MLRKLVLLAAVAAPLTILSVACDDDGGRPAVVNDGRDALEEEPASLVPVGGQFLADCPETGPDAVLAVIDEFVAPLGVDVPEEDLPTAEEVLASGDVDQVQIIGGLVPVDVDPEDLESIGTEDVEELLPAGLPVGLPVVSLIDVACSDLPTDLGDPEEALGAIPVFDENGDPVALVLATIENPPAGVPDIEGVSLSDELDSLPEPLGSTIGTILGLLSGLLP